MIAVDTNVLVRFLVNDHSAQAEIARALFQTETISISPTVFLEAQWVLQKTYRFRRHEVVAAFGSVFGVETVSVIDRTAVERAVLAFEQGFDFADALHLALCEDGVAELVTFDRAFSRFASPDLPPIRLLQATA